jgi:hypothetical protein
MDEENLSAAAFSKSASPSSIACSLLFSTSVNYNILERIY